MLPCSRHRQPRPVFAPLRLFPLHRHRRVRCARPGPSLAACLLVSPAVRYSPGWGRLAVPQRTCRAPPRFRLAWMPGGGGLPFFPSRAFDQRRSHVASRRAVSLTARPWRVVPPFPSRTPLPVGPGRKLLPCGLWRAGPCRRALLLLGYGVGLRQALRAVAVGGVSCASSSRSFRSCPSRFPAPTPPEGG